MTTRIHRFITGTGVLLLGVVFSDASAMPAFARKYEMSCAACHSAFPKLNQFGEHFAANNMRLPNWKDGTLSGGDERLALPKELPLAVRAQAYMQARQADNINPLDGSSRSATTDFQSPYLIKLLSSAPLSDHITYYFYAIFAEKGGNGEVIVEDAWFQHDDIFGSGTSLMLGQFQISDLMFPREVRLPFQDYMAYRLAGITYDRGVLFGRDFGPVEASFGLVNGNGVSSSFDLNSPGLNRPDNMFDNDNSKTAFGRLGIDIGPINVGLFGLSGKQRSVTGPAGLEEGLYNRDKEVWGLDASGAIGQKLHWYTQLLHNRWDRFIDGGPDRDYEWTGGFAGIDYIPNERWAWSLLYNYADADDLDNTDTIYEGISINSLTLTSSYYFMRNVKGIAELNVDLLDKDEQTGQYWTGHLSQEHYFLFGFDAAF
ncbi:MAG: porin [Gammaproteobacteria bacterium]|nr:porin [Gammaproteobacteria bacterium]